jgi:ubiquinone/menaquinone biosynthesis C-methylase UbiE
MKPKELVEAGYDHMAEQYLASKSAGDQALLAALEDLASRLVPGANVLDLGCGAGVPATQWLAQRFVVTGVDISARQLDLARQHVPAAHFIRSDMSSLEFPPNTFDAVVALYSIIHVPRDEQPDLLNRIYSWLKPSGTFLATWAMSEWEGDEKNWEGWGAPMWWSHYDAQTNLAMLRAAGFTIAWAEPRTSGSAGETWMWALAKRDT